MTAISLWVNVCIVHDAFDNVNSLDHADVDQISTEEICEDVEYDDVEAPVINSTSYYHMWKKKMTAYLDSKLTKDNLRLSYVVRSDTPPAEFQSLCHVFQWVI